MKSNNIDYVSENEEWIARYRKLQNSLEQIKTNDESNHNDWLVAATLVTRAGRLGMLQCATRDQGENTPSIENLLDQTKHEMDLDAASPKELLLLERLAAAAAAAPQNNHLDVQSQTSNVKEDICTAVDVDAFFEEYPECVKPSWDNRSEEVMDSSSDDDSETEVVEQRPRKDTKEESHPQQVIDVDESSNNRQRPHSLNPLAQAQQQQQQQQEQRPPSSSGRTQPRNPIVNNPYGNTRTQVPPRNPYQTTQHSNSFSYTPSTQPKADQSSSDNHNLLQNKNNNKNKNNNMPRGNQRYRPPSSYNASSLNRSSWEEHQNQQNPFQTARELAQIEEPTNKNDNNNSRNQERQDSGNWNQGQSNPYQNPYSRNNGTIRNDTVDEEATHVRGGPSIPQSLQRKFQVPMRNNEVASGPKQKSGTTSNSSTSKGGVQVRPPRPSSSSGKPDEEDELPEELQHLDKELVKKIQNEIMESGDTITFDDIAGLEDAKQTVQEVVCWPMKRPDLFTGLRRAPNGLLLYGPPGTGKTLIGKAIAHESEATFFSISSSSLTSKWIGEGEKLVRTLFAVAAYREPAVVFIDEIDSLLTQRKSTENEASRRIKTEFLVQLDGTGTSGQGRVLVIGATNRPQELDEAARRRFTKRLYIPLPAENDRRILLNVMLKKNNHRITEADIDRLARETDGFSGADLKALCTDAAMGPIRQLGPRALEVEVKDVPPISFKHFKRSLKGTRPSVAPSDLVQYEEWDKVYGSKRADEEDDDSDDESGDE